MELTLDQALQKGVEAHKAGKVQEADQYYTAILKANPKHPDANHNMGVLAVGVGKVQEALPFFKTALEANPSIAQFWLSCLTFWVQTLGPESSVHVAPGRGPGGVLGREDDFLGVQQRGRDLGRGGVLYRFAK